MRGVLVGRERELSELHVLLAEHRLVTVAGGVGVGKSRLAAAAVARTRRDLWQRVVRVRWRDNRPAGAPQLIAAVFHAVTGTPPPRKALRAGVGEVAAELRSGDTLLFLDDIDPAHLACVGVVQKLLESVPSLRVLVAARRPLGLGDERVLRLRPLDVTREGGCGDGPAPAVALFLDRAGMADDGCDAPPDGVDLCLVADICRSLDGLPLAIEMAAEQLARHGIGRLAELLRRDQCWLAGPRASLRRHRSLRSAVGAAYELCDRMERIVWARSSVFAGAFDESAAAFVCVGGSVEPQDVPACLARLAATGVLEQTRDPGGPRRPRYRMTRAARDFGAERLREAGEADVAAERHTVHCRRVAVVAENLWNSGGQPQAAELLQDEQDDLRVMLERAVEQPGQTQEVLETVVNLWFWWVVYGKADEGRRYLGRLLPRAPADRPVTVRALWLAAWLAACDDPRAAGGLLRRAWPAAVLLGDDAVIGRIAHVQGVLALHEGDLAAAAQHFDEAAGLIPARAPGGPSPTVSLAALAVAQAGFAPRAA
ncbi:hypothetical protein, partial [Streptomyces sp. TRM64462]|uniref:ATP-binding protein n=1 Tax=Streptomyces sp. TRM64462 TaxID=2741726 RepID=UPI0015867EE5